MEEAAQIVPGMQEKETRVLLSSSHTHPQ
jgi:hypothetical protein